ncbi:hypothetical protein [Rhodoplanes sp. Z2-YC6860]|uniref:hypothetical protein n=1 Tax=Rhodoplanes sp. Z2-YC6860 TaxID=674703 RepID=UPI00082D63C7|nr:hypothetical protein [Rhodoplanes sp. Z2-YC6860]
MATLKKLPEMARQFQLDTKLASQMGRKGGASARRLTSEQCHKKSQAFLTKVGTALNHKARAEYLALVDQWARLAVELEAVERLKADAMDEAAN